MEAEKAEKAKIEAEQAEVRERARQKYLNHIAREIVAGDKEVTKKMVKFDLALPNGRVIPKRGLRVIPKK